MTKVIAIFGAGTGLAASVARQYGRNGYAVALVARNADKLRSLADSFSSDGIETDTFIADVSESGAVEDAISAIRGKFGRIDAIYYAPNGLDSFTPANQLTPKILQPLIDLYFYGLLNVVSAVLPEFRARGEGVILSAFGGSAQSGFAFMSGIGPAMSAARNYLQSLQRELVSENIGVGFVTITAIVQNSAYHQGMLAAGGKTGLPDDMAFPVVDPDHLAALLDDALRDPSRVEASYPAT
ncbi:short-chain dehydrogenase [Pseudoxanthomonas jiangsuensis]|uniref:SDR family NAD(P)-dependent oxidoreductase n=1 Tax=Pseudoxanthomonas jiangsuensis TaxID=619688 RepID=UPI0013920CCD|nr:SDR family NAD(P)-dependent oxidoreductase [Pseudoxanthomonas jiangsuensis]KAF1697246.1 short-chain dehydrogenase [Pseudoxanthomonas jiangsuensis]